LNVVSKLFKFIIFADDTYIFIRGDNLEKLTPQINCELKEVNNCFSAIVLSVNIQKTNYIIFGNKKLTDISISINNEMTARTFETKFLGIIIQANLK